MKNPFKTLNKISKAFTKPTKKPRRSIKPKLIIKRLERVDSNAFYSKIRGVTFPNPDGTDRQKIIKQYCRPGQFLKLARVPTNEHPDAIAVLVNINPNSPKYLQIGHLGSEVAGEIAPLLDRDGLVVVQINEIPVEQKINPLWVLI